MKKLITAIAIGAMATGLMTQCSDQGVTTSSTTASTTLVDIAQTSGQLASGTSFTISQSSSDSTGHPRDHHGGKGGHGPALLDGLNLLAPNDEILAIVDAETASDFRGFRISRNGGATITNYDSNGNEVTLTPPAGDGPQGCSFSGHQFPEYDSLLKTIVKTVIDFGSGVTFKHDTITITRAGVITITRSVSGTTLTEVTTFDNYSANGIKIAGTKTRSSTFDSATGKGESKTTVSGGIITLADGTETVWTSEKERTSTVTLDENNHPVSGSVETTVNTSIVTSSGTVIYSHITTTPLIENIACKRTHHGPVSGVLETHYRDNSIIINFGDGTCDNQTISIDLNGVTTTKTIGG